jgi:hypothetical protein
VCAVVDGEELRVWNPTATTWVAPEDVHGYASIVAIRAGNATADGRTVSWGALRLPLGEWAPTTHGRATDTAATHTPATVEEA